MNKRKSSPSRAGAGFTLQEADLASIADPAGSGSLVDRIFDLVGGAIKSRRVASGVRLPSVRQLADDCHISRDTAARAYDKLVAHGLVESRRGAGYFVKAPSTRRSPDRVLQARPSLFRPDGLTATASLRLRLQRPIATQPLHSYSGIGTLPEDWMAEQDIATALRTVVRGSPRALASAGDPQGYLPLRQQLQLKLHDMGLQVDPAHLVLTSGATDALNLVALSFLRRAGESVLIEQPCQPILIERLLSVGLVPYSVPREADGPDLDVLRALCAQHRPGCFFISPTLHNPTGSNLSPHKAFQLLRLAEEFDLTLVEDDTYGDLVATESGVPVTRLAPLDQLQRVIHIGSFSKTIAPGLRVGYLAASPERIEWMATYRALNCLATNSLAERTVYQLLSQGNYRHHCSQLRSRLAELRPRAMSALQKIGIRVAHEPDAGYYLWADLGPGVDAFKVSQQLLAQGHLTSPGVLFSAAHRSYMRFNIATMLAGDALPALARALGR